MSKKLVRVAVGFFLKGDGSGRALMGLRPGGKQHGHRWEWPGGKVEPNETAEEAVVREWREELGVNARVDRRLGAALLDSHCLCILELFSMSMLSAEVPLIRPLEHSCLEFVHPADAEGFVPQSDRTYLCTPGTVVLMPHVRTYFQSIGMEF